MRCLSIPILSYLSAAAHLGPQEPAAAPRLSEARLALYVGIDNYANVIAQAVAVSVDVDSCRVRLDGGVVLDPSAVARLDTVLVSEFRVLADAGLPAALRGALEALDESGQLTLVGRDGDPVVRVRAGAAGDAVEVLSPDGSTRLESIPWEVPEDAEAVTAELLHRARVHRLLSLEHDEGRVSVLLEPFVETDAGREPLVRPRVDGVLRLRRGDRADLIVANGTRRDLHVHLIKLDSVPTPEGATPLGDVELLVGASKRVVKRGERLVLGTFTAETTAASLERTTLKLIASARHLAGLDDLIRGDPDRERGAPDPVRDLVSRAIEGELERGPRPSTGATGTYWATASLAFDVEDR